MGTYGTAEIAGREELERQGLLSPWEPGTVPGGLLLGWHREGTGFAPITYKGDLHQLIVAGTGGGKFVSALAPMLMGSDLDPNTVVVVDPKGEIAEHVGRYFQKPFGEKNVFLLDPMNECGTGHTDSLNFLSHIRLDNPRYLQDARALAEALVIASGSENTHWDNAARNFATALILYVALDPREKDNPRDLVRVRELLNLPWSLPPVTVNEPKAGSGAKTKAAPKGKTAQPRRGAALSTLLYAFMENNLAEGAIRLGFMDLLNKEERERSGVLSSLRRDTAWIIGKQMTKVLRGPGIDLKRAALSNGKYFIVLPMVDMETHKGWLRLCVTAFSSAFKSHRLPAAPPGQTRWRHIVIDEFANLGNLPMVVTDLAIGRGYGVKYHLAVQSFAQLSEIYEDNWHTIIGNTFQRVFRVGDSFTSKEVAELLGHTTVRPRSVSRSSGTSTGETRGTSLGTSTGQTMGSSYGYGTSYTQGSSRAGPSLSGGTSQNSGSSVSSSTTESSTESETFSDTRSLTDSESYNEAGRLLFTADEVRRLPADEEFLTMPSMNAARCWHPPYWEVFPSLPQFTLKEVLDTIGRQPSSQEEQRRFLDWRREKLLMMPPAAPVAMLQQPLRLPPPPEPAPRTWFDDLRELYESIPLWVPAAVVGLMAIVAWLWPNGTSP